MSLLAIDPSPVAEAAPPLLKFFVPGIPAPGGSKRAFAVKKGGVYTGRVVVMDDAGQRNKDWRSIVAWRAREAMLAATLVLLTIPIAVDFEFTMPRLKAHQNSKGLLKASAPTWHATRPDCTKLIRSTEDAMKGIVWLDDNLIVAQRGFKRYGEQPGCLVMVWPA